MNSEEIKKSAKQIRGEIEMLHECAVRELEVVATAAVDDFCVVGDILSPVMVRLRDALLAIELTREMRV